MQNNKDGGISDNVRRTFLSPDWTIRYLLEKYPLTRLCFAMHVAELDERGMNSTLRDFLNSAFANKQYGSVFRCFLAAALNNVVGSYYGAPLCGPSDWLHDNDGLPPDGFWTESPIPISLTDDRLGISAVKGLPAPYYWSCGGAWNVRYAASSGSIDHISCWNWKSGHRGSQNLFTNGGLTFGSNRSPHIFEEVKLWPFGFENRWGKNRENKSVLCLEEKSLTLNLNVKGDAWVSLDWNSRLQTEGTRWRALGWDKAAQAFILYVSYTHNRFANGIRFAPYARQFDIKEIADLSNRKADFELAESPDRIVAGNLYLLIDCNGGPPETTGDGKLKWSGHSDLMFQITAGTTYREAAEELNRTRANRTNAVKRCLTHYRQVRKRIPIASMPGHPNIELTASVSPLLLESLKLAGNDKMRYGPGTSGYVDIHTSLMAMRGILFNGDFEFADNFLAFLSAPEHRGPKGQIAVNHFYDWTVDSYFQDWVFNDVTYLALIGHFQWHSRGNGGNRHYTYGREHLLRIMEDADPETGLFRTRGYWPDHPQKDVGRKGRPWPINEAGIWYEALRNWEILALRHNDQKLAAKARTISRKVQASFVPLFFDPEVGFFCDNVDPRTRKRHPQYSLFSTHFMYGMFGHELIDNATARRVAETAYAGLYDPAWKMFRTCLPAGSFYSQFEFIYAHWLQGLSKLFRITRHQKGLLAIRDSYEFHFGKFCNFPESFNMKPDLTLEQHGAGGWFIETLGTRYQVILENLYGINLTPDNLGICPWGIHTGKMRLENLTAGKSRWSFDYRGRGEWPEKILLDGKNYPSSWVFPGRTLNGGSHTVEVVFGDNKPSHQVLLEAAGVELVDAKVKNSILKVRVQGTGRAYLRFFCPDEPTVRINGKPVKHVWDPVSQQAVIEVTSINGLEIELENRNSHTLN